MNPKAALRLMVQLRYDASHRTLPILVAQRVAAINYFDKLAQPWGGVYSSSSPRDPSLRPRKYLFIDVHHNAIPSLIDNPRHVIPYAPATPTDAQGKPTLSRLQDCFPDPSQTNDVALHAFVQVAQNVRPTARPVAFDLKPMLDEMLGVSGEVVPQLLAPTAIRTYADALTHPDQLKKPSLVPKS